MQKKGVLPALHTTPKYKLTMGKHPTFKSQNRTLSIRQQRNKLMTIKLTVILMVITPKAQATKEN